MATKDYKMIFEPINIGKMQLKNRIVMPPMGTAYSEAGMVGSRTIDYYEARAKGGTGLIIVEGTAPGERCRGVHQLGLGDDKYIPGWENLVKAVHKHDAKIAVQLHHAGFEIRDGNFVQVAPSAISSPGRMIGIGGRLPHELTVAEIEDIIQWFAEATRRARDAGVDGVEIHGAHQYIVASFLSSASNKREDKYGGNLENKTRFLIEITETMKAAVGADYPVWPRLNVMEYGIENGITIEETLQVVPMAVAAGSCAIHASAYAAFSHVTKAPLPDTPAFLIPLAEEVKKVTNVPVITVGRLDHETGEKALRESKADLVAIGRRLIADPELPNKVAKGKFEDINYCIGCMECIERLGRRGEGVICTINAATGHEGDRRIRPARKKKKVMVVGGGPAGMETARVAAIRGFNVTLLEKDKKLGGQLNIAALPPNKGDILPWLDYMIAQLKKAGVETHLGVEATPELIEEEKPDAVILALGGIPLKPAVPGIDGSNVVTAQDVLFGKAQAGQNIVIIGGGLVGCDTAHYLASKGKKIIIIEILKRVAMDMGPMARRRLLDGLRAHQVAMLTEVTCEEITEEGVKIATADGESKMLPADTVILAAGYGKNDEMLKTLKEKVAEVFCVGDAAEPCGIMEAVRDGYLTALAL
ncbi:MAG: FAD-dependent oxidoreductase [Deltaproteobacteria bacterium]|nr:FAD-dependent oxidoreductase [Deltaproteobacteria bacterium]